MNPQKDYYATLGVLPSAEDVVIRAAYKALAQRYHPDRYTGPQEDATRLMAEINEAYSVLSDPESRRAYDRARGDDAKDGGSYFGGDKEEPPPSSDPLEKDWGLANSFYPDLADIEKRLALFSWRLSYSFRAFVLQEKAFENRHSIARTMEANFLELYFGTNPKVVAFARGLIEEGQKDAAKALNEVVRVLGSNIEAERVIDRLTDEFDLNKTKEQEKRENKARKLFAEDIMSDLAKSISARNWATRHRNNCYISIDEKIDFIGFLGGKFEWGGSGGSCRIELFGQEKIFADRDLFSDWFSSNLVPFVMEATVGVSHVIEGTFKEPENGPFSEIKGALYALLALIFLLWLFA